MLWLTTYARSVAGHLLSLPFTGAQDNGSLLRESLLVCLHAFTSDILSSVTSSNSTWDSLCQLVVTGTNPMLVNDDLQRWK
ncbi:hypothetical protein AVEN_186037-1 [Araneus ventricosus]|uniref:Uncharacterized protein n=1 Tax=Araneus ventricosus TaxID=182803 RepID=A0A4Y2MFZ3_ARAVE|nr:hypothetical protein AVEN_186037-1 [Araneus ventricosus]